MHRAAVQLDAGLERPLMGVEAVEGGQQRRVDVDQPVAPALDEILRQQAHEAGEADDVDPRGLEPLLDRRLEGGAVLDGLGVDDRGGDAGLGRLGEPGGIRTVGQHQHDLGRIVRASPRRAISAPCWCRARK